MSKSSEPVCPHLEIMLYETPRGLECDECGEIVEPVTTGNDFGDFVRNASPEEKEAWISDAVRWANNEQRNNMTNMLSEVALRYGEQKFKEGYEAAKEALPNQETTGNDKLPQPSLPVERLEDILEPFKLVWDVAAQGPAHQLDDPFKVGDRLYDFQTPPKIALLDYIGRLIEREKQKARIEELETVLKVLNDVGRREPGFYTIEYVHDRLKELREESNT